MHVLRSSVVLLLENVLGIVLYFMRNQDLQIFVLKCFLAMVLWLSLNVLLDSRFLRVADSECGVPWLPLKFFSRFDRFIDPTRRIGFNKFQHVRNGDSCWETGQDMNMVFDAANFQQHAVFFANDATNVLIQPLTKLWPNDFSAILCAED